MHAHKRERRTLQRSSCHQFQGTIIPELVKHHTTPATASHRGAADQYCDLIAASGQSSTKIVNFHGYCSQIERK